MTQTAQFSPTTLEFYAQGTPAPADSVAVSSALHSEVIEARDAGKIIGADENGQPTISEPPPPPPETPEQTQLRLTEAVQLYLDQAVQQRNYDNILSCATYASSTNATFAAEGQAAIEWRDAVWIACYQILADVTAGVRPVPTGAELIAELPVIQWPAEPS